MEVEFCPFRSGRIGWVERVMIERSSTTGSTYAAQALALLLG
jgi:hypothetical protein